MPVTLITPRLKLRPVRPDDFPAYAALMASPRSAGMGGPFGASALWGLFCHGAAGWALFGHGSLMIDLVATGACIGEVGLNDGPQFAETELGWFLYDGFEGHGYATEAAAALRDYAFDVLNLPTLVSYMAPDNARSAAVATRLGGMEDPSAPRIDPTDRVFRYMSRGARTAATAP